MAAMEVDVQTGRSLKGSRRCAASRRCDEVEQSAEEFVHAFSTAFGVNVTDNDSAVSDRAGATDRTGRTQKGTPGAAGASGFFGSNSSYSWFLNALSSVRAGSVEVWLSLLGCGALACRRLLISFMLGCPPVLDRFAAWRHLM